MALKLEDVQNRAKIVEQLEKLPIWTAQDFCFYYNVSISWLYLRTCLLSKHSPKIPTIKSVGHIRINKDDAKRIMSMYLGGGSLKIEDKTKKSMRSLTSNSKEREKVSLW